MHDIPDSWGSPCTHRALRRSRVARTLDSVTSTWAHRRAHAQIEDLARQSLDSVALRGALLGVLAEALEFDGYVWVLTDPVTSVGAAPLADVPGLPLTKLALLIRAKYATTENRWTVLLRGPSPVGLLSTASESDPERRSEWRDLLDRHGIQDVASVVFSDPFGCWGFLDLWRSDHKEPFDDSDVQLLTSLAPALTTALRGCQARTFVDAAKPHRESVGPVVLTLDDSLRITSRTAASEHWLEVLLPRGQGAHAIPASVYNVAAQLLAVEAGVDGHPASTRTHLRDGFWLTLRAARFTPVEPRPTAPEHSAAGIVVTIEETSPSERLEVFGRAFGLTPREGELVGLLATGADTRSMARRMVLSEHTVQDHLKSIFTKTGARDRVTVLSRALGTQPPTRPRTRC